MKKVFFALVITILAISLVSAIDLTVEKQTTNVAMISGLNRPAIFDLKITNNEGGNYFIFYNFFGSDTLPKGTVTINGGETKEIQVGVYPREDLKQEGWVKFDMYVKGEAGDQTTFPLMVNIIKLKDGFEVGAEEFKPGSNKVNVYIKNRVNFNFEEIQANFKSPFFNFEEIVSLKPYEKKSFEVNLNKEDFRALIAGFYTLNVEINADNQRADVEGVIKFSEENIVIDTQNQYGVIINTNKITKTNEGNIVSPTVTVIKKNVISRLFTNFNPEPDIVERKGFLIYYTWEKELKPGEQFVITVKTNWLLPLLAILLIIAIVILTKQFSRTNLSLKKKVTFVKAKGGEFALKVSIMVTARKFIERVNIVDRLPPITKLHERFGGEMPKKVDVHNRKMEWYFDRLQEGESRVISYIIYSRIGVLGRFALPKTTAIYEKDGEVHEAESNQAFFIAEQARKPIED